MRSIAAMVVAFVSVACVADVARATEPFAKVVSADWAHTEDNSFLDIDRDAFGAMVGIRW